MGKNLKNRKKLKPLILNLGIGLLLCTFFIYFSLIAINGNHGIKKKSELEFEVIELRSKLIKLNNIAATIEIKTQKLQENKLDLDLLDEQARKILGLIRQDERIIK